MKPPTRKKITEESESVIEKNGDGRDKCVERIADVIKLTLWRIVCLTL